MESTRRVNSYIANDDVLVEDSDQENDEDRMVVENCKKSMSKEMNGMKRMNQRYITFVEITPTYNIFKYTDKRKSKWA